MLETQEKNPVRGHHMIARQVLEASSEEGGVLQPREGVSWPDSSEPGAQAWGSLSRY